jgi:NAD-dependent deacetylase
MSDYLFSRTFLSLLKRSKRVMISTGAGISAESGAPTFRSPTGLWKEFDPNDYATPEAFENDPLKVWKFYDWRRTVYRDMQPNPGHYALVEMENIYPEFSLFTQNVDGLHQKAGSNNVYELHGNIWKVRCLEEGREMTLYDTPLPVLPPHCGCGGILRPGVVWFGEPLPTEILDKATESASRCEAFFVIGSSAIVQPAASLAWIARDHGALVVEINTESTPATDIADESFRGKSGIILPELIKALKNHDE